MRRAARTGDGWYGWWAQPDLAAHLDQLHSILADHNRVATDHDFAFKLGLPLGRETPDEIAAKVAEARDLGVDELILAGAVPTSSFESALTTLAQAAGLT